MMDNYQNQIKLTTDAYNAQGFALEVNEKRMESFSAKQEQIAATAAGIWNSIVNTALIKSGMDVIQEFLDLLDGAPAKMMLFVTALFALTSGFNALKASSIGLTFIQTGKEIAGKVKKTTFMCPPYCVGNNERVNIIYVNKAI